DGGGDRQAPPSPAGCQEGEGDEREAERGVARAERAVAVALLRRHQGGGELLVAAEGDDLRGSRAPPMVLEHGVDQKTRTDREGEDEIERRPGIAAKERPPGEIM